MASEVKGAHCGILKNLSSIPALLSEAVDLRHLVCAAFFITGLQPEGCTKQLTEVEAGRSFAWTSRLQALGLRLRKSRVPRVGYSKRRALAPPSVGRKMAGDVAVVDGRARRVQHT